MSAISLRCLNGHISSSLFSTQRSPPNRVVDGNGDFTMLLRAATIGASKCPPCAANLRGFRKDAVESGISLLGISKAPTNSLSRHARNATEAPLLERPLRISLKMYPNVSILSMVPTRYPATSTLLVQKRSFLRPRSETTFRISQGTGPKEDLLLLVSFQSFKLVNSSSSSAQLNPSFC